MSNLPTVNQKSVYAAAGFQYADADQIEDPVTRISLRLKALDIQYRIYIAEQRNRALDQIDKLNNIKTEMRIIETKNFDQIPLQECNTRIL